MYKCQRLNYFYFFMRSNCNTNVRKIRKMKDFIDEVSKARRRGHISSS
eukprot:UN25241